MDKPKSKKPRRDYPAAYRGNYGPTSPYQKLLGEEYQKVAMAEEVTRTETRKWLVDAWKSEEARLLEMMQRTNVPAGQKLIAACLVNAIQVGDYQMMNTFLNRIVGKVKEEIVLTPGQTEQNPDSARQLLLEAIIEPGYKRVE